jgi:hypothetical protein
MRHRVLSTIGPIQLIVEDDTVSHNATEAARMSIPDHVLADLLFKGLHRAFHNGMMTPELWDMCDVVREQPRPGGERVAQQS